MTTVLQTLKKYVTKRPVTQATIVRVEEVSPQFRLLEFRCHTPLKTAIAPGDKMSVMLDGKKRTYTPISLAADSTRIRLGVFLHGNDPGSVWASSVRVSDVCTLTGPRPSLDLKSVQGPCVLFGDETSFAVAAALQRHAESSYASRCFFEVGSSPQAQAVVTALGLVNTILVERAPRNSHLQQLSTTMKLAVGELGARRLVLTGCASSIQAVRKILNSTESEYSRGLVKAYWSHEKSGLD